MKQPIDTKGLQSIVDGQLALGLKAVEAVEQLGALQLNTTKALLEQSVKQHQALLGVKTPQDFRRHRQRCLKTSRSDHAKLPDRSYSTCTGYLKGGCTHDRGASPRGLSRCLYLA